MSNLFTKKNHFWLTVILVTLLSLCVFGILLMASVPPVSRDALIHHLSIPKLYLQHGRMIELPDIPFSYYPMNLDLLYLIPLMFGNDILPKYIHMLFGIFSAVLIFQYLRKRTGTNYGLCGALLWFSMPIVTRLSTEVYVDLGLAFFSFASLYHVVLWVNSRFRYKYLIYSGIFCGLALGTKYNGLLSFTVLSLMIPFIYSRLSLESKLFQPTKPLNNSPAAQKRMGCQNVTSQSSFGALKSIFCFAGVALLIYSPWMIRNTVLKQNPIYPMMNQLFISAEQEGNTDSIRASTLVQNTGNTLSIRRLVFKESFGYISLIPIRLFFEGKDDDPRRFDGKLNPFLLIFMFAGLWNFLGKNNQMRVERWIWFSFAMLFMAMVIFTASIRVRYLMPILPAIIILSIVGIHNAFIAIDRYKNSRVAYCFMMSILIGCVLNMFLYNGNYFVERFEKLQTIPYLSGRVTRDDYIAHYRPEYPLVQYANTHLSPDDRLLGLFLGQRRYYFDRDITFNEGILLAAVRRAMDPSDILSYLQNHQLSHLIIRNDLFKQWLSRNTTMEEIKILDAFWKNHMQKLNELNGYALYAIIE